MPLDHDSSLTHWIIGPAMRVHMLVGPGLPEQIYQRCLCFELERDGLPYACQVNLPLLYEDVRFNCGFRADIIVSAEAILEIKAVEPILPLQEVRLQTYLHSAPERRPVGLLLNFNMVSPERWHPAQGLIEAGGRRSASGAGKSIVGRRMNRAEPSRPRLILPDAIAGRPSTGGRVAPAAHHVPC